ncbi:MAG: DNA primase [Bacilli bacterium]|nr:DNA primase [Bacilli bacterium]
MAILSDKEIESIRSSANIVDIISSYIPLTLKGKNYFGVCPFHEDHSPSMSVSTDKQIYKCFSCGAAGNVFSFVKDYENVSFLESVKIVAQKIGYNIKIITPNTKTAKNTKELEAMDLALKFYQNYLKTKDGEKARKYLNERGLSDDVIKTFDIGLSPFVKDNLATLLLKKGFDQNTLKEVGLINVDGARIYDSFCNRIIFPIHNLEGHPIAFTGRIYGCEKTSKYFNSRESKIFKKGQILYNYHRALEFIKQKREVVIVEGNMDAIRMYASGIKNTIALMGTSLTKEQRQIIKKLRAKVILMLDNDEAGELATLSIGQALENDNIECFVVRLSDYKDPDEYIIKMGTEKIESLISSSISFLEFKLFYYRQNKDLNNTYDLITYIKQILSSVENIKDKLTREITLKKLSEQYDIPIELLKEHLNDLKKDKVNQEPIMQDKVKTSKYQKIIQRIIFYLISDPAYIIKFEKSNLFINDQKYRNLINEIIYYYKKNKTISMAEFISYMSTNSLNELFLKIISDIEEDIENDNFEQYIINLTKINNEDKIRKLKNELKTTLDVNKKISIANEIIKLKKEV